MFEKHYQETILVRDKVLAAALLALDHHALMLYQDMQGGFYCSFAITRNLREDIRSYRGDGLKINPRQLDRELEEINMYLADYECYVHAKLSEFYADAADD
ncbi:MAG TPA: hypothetical protein VG964_02430 [Candidatus Saccharimonadales bacterium]|nr:hypothetical protein [Candidatus Saccharimonadales bacterium]